MDGDLSIRERARGPGGLNAGENVAFEAHQNDRVVVGLRKSISRRRMKDGPRPDPFTSLHAPQQTRLRLKAAHGVTIRKTADMIVGTFCIAGGHSLLHQDRDFDPMVTHLSLRLALTP